MRRLHEKVKPIKWARNRMALECPTLAAIWLTDPTHWADLFSAWPVPSYDGEEPFAAGVVITPKSSWLLSHEASRRFANSLNVVRDWRHHCRFVDIRNRCGDRIWRCRNIDRCKGVV